MRHCLVALTFLFPGLGYADELDLVGVFSWPGEGVNGLSGLEVSADGLAFTTVSDRGWILTGSFARGTNGQITDIEVTGYDPLMGLDGWPRAARRVGDWSDAEGLAIAPDGTLFVSFERWAHVASFETPAGAPTTLRSHPLFQTLKENRQLEALAIRSDGHVIVMTEKPVSDHANGFPVFLYADDEWEVAGTIEARNRFSVVGADFDAEDRLFLLERKLIFGLWWQSRIRVFEDPDGPGEVLWTSRRGEYFNLEGIAVWQDALGPRLTLVSDNNADQGEPTQFIEFRLTE